MKATRLFLLLMIMGSISIGLNGQTNVGGIISTNTTWTQNNSPYIVTNKLLVIKDVTLTIEPNVEIRFNFDTYLKIEGTLNAQGTGNEKIKFTSNSVNPTIDSWKGLIIRPTGGTKLNTNLTFNSGTILRHCEIEYSGTGIYVFKTGLLLDNVTFYANKKSIEIRNTNSIVIDNCVFNSNDTGIYSEYEDYASGDDVYDIKNTYIQNSVFKNNKEAIALNMNQRDFNNLNIRNNWFENNLSAIAFGGGGYGPRIHSVYIYQNKLFANKNAININQVYGPSETTTPTLIPIQVYENIILNSTSHSLSLNFVNVNTQIRRNIISNNAHGLVIDGMNESQFQFNSNQILNNNFGVYIGKDVNAYLYHPENVTFLNNCFTGYANNSLAEIMQGKSISFSKNNFHAVNQYHIKNLTPHSITATNNYWVSLDDSLFYDYYDDFEVGIISYKPALNTPDTTTPISPPRNVIKSANENGVRISWTPNPESDLAGYKIYYKPKDAFSYEKVIDVGNVKSYRIAGVDLCDTIVVTAYDKIANGTDDQIKGHESWYSFAQIHAADIAVYTNNYCFGDPIEIEVDVQKEFESNNSFKVELSDATGSFDNPVILVQTNASSSFITKITVSEPMGTGTSYLIRVKSTHPEIFSEASPLQVYPALASTFTIDDRFCGSRSISVSYTGNADDQATYNWDFDGGIIVSNNGQESYQVKWEVSGDKTIGLKVAENGCFSEVSSETISVSITQPNPICVVSVNQSNKNMIFWKVPEDNPYQAIIIYKESQPNDFIQIGTQKVSEPSFFIDQHSNASLHPTRYKLAVIDTCGYTTALSQHHKTIHLSLNATQTGAWDLTWNHYEGFDSEIFHVFRGTSADDLIKVAELSNTTYTDIDPPAGNVYYKVVVINDDPCMVCSVNLSEFNNLSSFSNIANTGQVSVAPIDLSSSIKIFPNPVSDLLYVETQGTAIPYRLIILALDGRVLQSTFTVNGTTQVDISGLSNGAYIVKFISGDKSINRLIVKN
jgi:hypothetical protein